VTPSRAPWWFYILAVSFLSSFPLLLYNSVWGPGDDGITLAPVGGYLIVKEVQLDKPAGRAGMRAGDRILNVDGIPMRGALDYQLAKGDFESGRPIAIKIERDGKPAELTMTLQPGSLGGLSWIDWEASATAILTFGLALIIGVRRPREPAARICAWFLASFAMDIVLVIGAGWTSYVRHLPLVLGLLLWPSIISTSLSAAIGLTFPIVFPRVLIRNRLFWVLIWLPELIVGSLQTVISLEMVYRPRQTPTEFFLVNVPAVDNWLTLFYVFAIPIVWTIQYRSLKDPNERRRMRVIFAGGSVGCLAVSAIMVSFLSGSVSTADPIFVFSFALYAAFPLAMAYAVLRHRVFDLRLIVRRGLQYALARGALVSAVPILAAIFTADLLLHGDQPILAVLRGRGWIYGALATLAAFAYTKRQNWLETLDRRFFREQYDARRLLCDVVEEVRVARNFEEEAPRVATRIESALHPEFVAFLLSEPREQFYRTLIAVPSGTGPPALKKEGKLLSLIRLLGKPVEVPQTESGWLQQQLPHEETEFLRHGRIDLLVPVATDPQRTEVLMVLGVKRSEEPYSGEDQHLLVAIAASLAILLEKTAARATLPRADILEECPQCGLCYDSDSTQCKREGARLVPVILPRLLEGRYNLERRLGRGGMGTVYCASDKLLERLVAVKVIREDLVGSAEAAERFRREARAAASFAHPNVVTVHDFGVASGTRAFLVMEMLEGLTLREKLRSQKRLPTARLLGISRDVCAALTAAHRRHLVHRDLKPENIFLVSTESSEIAKVLDFGVAKFISAYTEQGTVDTAIGAVLGTLRYMSPEQRGGQAAHQAWDLWALAVMTYEMLTGCYPFEDSSFDWLSAGPVVPFTPIAMYVPGAAKKLQGLFEHSFARELSDRHDSAEAFLSELQSAAN